MLPIPPVYTALNPLNTHFFDLGTSKFPRRFNIIGIHQTFITHSFNPHLGKIASSCVKWISTATWGFLRLLCMQTELHVTCNKLHYNYICSYSQIFLVSWFHFLILFWIWLVPQHHLNKSQLRYWTFHIPLPAPLWHGAISTRKFLVVWTLGKEPCYWLTSLKKGVQRRMVPQGSVCCIFKETMFWRIQFCLKSWVKNHCSLNGDKLKRYVNFVKRIPAFFSKIRIEKSCPHKPVDDFD